MSTSVSNSPEASKSINSYRSSGAARPGSRPSRDERLPLYSDSEVAAVTWDVQLCHRDVDTSVRSADLLLQYCQSYSMKDELSGQSGADRYQRSLDCKL